MLLNTLRWLLGYSRKPTAVTRLTAGQALELAMLSPQVRESGRQLWDAVAIATPAGPIWRVSGSGVGVQWWVEINDQTGAVGELHDPQCG